jgi:hypothetical protein
LWGHLSVKWAGNAGRGREKRHGKCTEKNIGLQKGTTSKQGTDLQGRSGKARRKSNYRRPPETGKDMRNKIWPPKVTIY